MEYSIVEIIKALDVQKIVRYNLSTENRTF